MLLTFCPIKKNPSSRDNDFIQSLSVDYEFPTNGIAPRVNSNKLYHDYTRGIYYSDYALGSFFDKVRKSKLAENTLFIITADHGVWIYPDNKAIDNVIKQEIYFRMPLLFWSPKLIVPGVNPVLGSQLDIAPTILDIIRIRAKNSFLGTSLLRNDTEPRFRTNASR